MLISPFFLIHRYSVQLVCFSVVRPRVRLEYPTIERVVKLFERDVGIKYFDVVFREK